MNQAATQEFALRYGPWAIVAGASDGLGAEFATQLAAKGLNLVLVARREDKLRELSDRLAADNGIQVLPVTLDLSRPDVAEQLAAATQGKEIGLLVYNAALGPTRLFFDSPIEEHRDALATNCWGPLSLVYAFAPQGVDVLASMPAAIETPNYRLSLGSSGKESVSAMSPSIVVAESLDALGKQPGVIPGFVNRLQGFIMRRLLPRRLSIRLMSRVLSGMYRVN